MTEVEVHHKRVQMGPIGFITRDWAQDFRKCARAHVEVVSQKQHTIRRTTEESES
jgi:hypothetical protein